MKRIQIYFLLSLFCFVVNTCINDYSDFEYGNNKPEIVIEALLTNDTLLCYVKISKSSRADNYKPTPVNDADITISDSEYTYIFTLENDGIYKCRNLVGKINMDYALRVLYNDTLYESYSTLRPGIILDSLMPEYKTNAYNNTQGYSVFIYAQKAIPDLTSYYRVKIYCNDSLYNNYNDLLVVSDQYMNTFNGLELPYSFKQSDTVKVEVYTINAAMYDYYAGISELTTNSLNTIYYYHTNPPNNLSNNALGYFQTSAVSSKEIVIP